MNRTTHPENVPYVLAMCECDDCLENKRFPDRAAEPPKLLPERALEGLAFFYGRYR